jgi:hypothetical protein
MIDSEANVLSYLRGKHNFNFMRDSADEPTVYLRYYYLSKGSSTTTLAPFHDDDSSEGLQYFVSSEQGLTTPRRESDDDSSDDFAAIPGQMFLSGQIFSWYDEFDGAEETRFLELHNLPVYKWCVLFISLLFNLNFSRIKMFLNLIMSGKESKHLFIMPHNLFHHFLF